MKLELGKSYTVYTISDYITNKQVKILGLLTYEEAAAYDSFISNVAINEKFIDSTQDQDAYLAAQTYYKCGTISSSVNGYIKTGETVILWDDIIDSSRTEILYEDHVYKMTFKLKNIDSTDDISKDGVISAIEDTIASKYNGSKEKVAATFSEILDGSLNSVSTQLEETQETLTEATDALNSFISLQTEAKKISDNLVDNNIVTRMTALETSMNNLESSISLILSHLS